MASRRSPGAHHLWQKCGLGSPSLVSYRSVVTIGNCFLQLFRPTPGDSRAHARRLVPLLRSPPSGRRTPARRGQRRRTRRGPPGRGPRRAAAARLPAHVAAVDPRHGPPRRTPPGRRTGHARRGGEYACGGRVRRRHPRVRCRSAAGSPRSPLGGRRRHRCRNPARVPSRHVPARPRQAARRHGVTAGRAAGGRGVSRARGAGGSASTRCPVSRRRC